jgi:hypothetical protein
MGRLKLILSVWRNDNEGSCLHKTRMIDLVGLIIQ